MKKKTWIEQLNNNKSTKNTHHFSLNPNFVHWISFVWGIKLFFFAFFHLQIDLYTVWCLCAVVVQKQSANKSITSILLCHKFQISPSNIRNWVGVNSFEYARKKWFCVWSTTINTRWLWIQFWIGSDWCAGVGAGNWHIYVLWKVCNRFYQLCLFLRSLARNCSFSRACARIVCLNHSHQTYSFICIQCVYVSVYACVYWSAFHCAEL